MSARQVFGELIRTETTETGQKFVYQIPAVNKALAQQRARVNVRVKGYTNPRVTESRTVGQGPIPVTSVYEVEVRT